MKRDSYRVSGMDSGASSDKSMGDELKTIYEAIWQEVAWLHFRYAEYTKLFAKGEKRIEILNSVAPHFFAIAQEVLLETTMLHVAKLLDPSRSCGKENLMLPPI